MAVGKLLESACTVKGDEVDTFEENEGRRAEPWANCLQGIHDFTMYFWHSEGWSIRSEELIRAALSRVAATKSHWIIACETNMEPVQSNVGDWFAAARSQIRVQANAMSGHTALGQCGQQQH